jgi:hypothetical protein
VLFLDFPPVLQLQLKRFEYDYMRDTMVKVRTVLNTTVKMINHFYTSLSLFQADSFFLIEMLVVMACQGFGTDQIVRL